MSNAAYFRRKNKIFVDGSATNVVHFSEVATLDSNLRTLGYALDNELAARLLTAPVEVIISIHTNLVDLIKELKGVRNYRPMYPNFPAQVMNASAAELHINAIMHYFGDVIGYRIMPDYVEAKRPVLDFDESKITLIGLGNIDEYNEMYRNLLSSTSAFSEADREDIKALSDVNFYMLLSEVKGKLSNRENKAFLANLALTKKIGLENFNFDTATDILRLAVAMSDGDISLSENTRFRNFNRPERRMLLGLLAKVEAGIVEDMMRNQSMWKRLGERLHPGDYNYFPHVQEAFGVIRGNDNGFKSFNAKVEAAIANGNVVEAVERLSARPGEFARRLDKLMRMSDGLTQGLIVSEFKKVADKVSATVLVQARNAFLNRGKPVRVFFPKGSVSKMQSIKSDLGELTEAPVTLLIEAIDNALGNQFKDRGSLGSSYVDPALKDIAVPFGLRNASKAIRTYGRGSRLALGEDSNIIRFFIWWKDVENGYSRTDIDLSAVMFDDSFNLHSYITFYNLRNDGAVHSGDITSAPNGASEFIDIDIDTLKAKGVRYVAMTLHSYSGQSLSELPECFAGFMERVDLDSGEVYDPRTVTNKADLTSNTRAATPFIFDLETRQAIWVDLSMQVSGSYSTVRSTKGQIASVVEAMTTLTPPNLYDLFAAHATARGGIVGDKEDADTIFSFDGDVTPFDTETILSEYL